MPTQTRVLSPGPAPRIFRTADGKTVSPPADWTLVPPGDPGLTRRIKAAGPSWTVQEKKGRKVFSRGVWAPAAMVESVRRQLEAERSTPAYAAKRQSEARRRDQKQTAYVETFEQSVLAFLNFAPAHRDLAEKLARAVTEHATPVGSGTVARTERIPVEERAEAAVIAWLRHRTTAYDNLSIPRIKGKRREVRRMLAAGSKKLLDQYRQGHAVDGARCPLQRALQA